MSSLVLSGPRGGTDSEGPEWLKGRRDVTYDDLCIRNVPLHAIRVYGDHIVIIHNLL